MAERKIEVRCVRFLRELALAGPHAESIKSHERAQVHAEFDEAIRQATASGGFIVALNNIDEKVNLFGKHLIIDDPDCWVYRLRARVELP